MSALGSKRPFAASAPKDGFLMSALRTKLPFAASAPKDGLPMSAMRTYRTYADAARSVALSRVSLNLSCCRAAQLPESGRSCRVKYHRPEPVIRCTRTGGPSCGQSSPMRLQRNSSRNPEVNVALAADYALHCSEIPRRITVNVRFSRISKSQRFGIVGNAASRDFKAVSGRTQDHSRRA